MKLKLITTETFGTVPCDFYRNMNNDMLLTRNQIGQALEYSNPQKAIDNIHSKHKDRLDELSVITKLRATDGKEYMTTLYTQRGVMEICRWSRQPKANQFMDWVWDIIESYRNNTLSSQNIDMNAFTDILTSLSNTQAAMAQTLNLLNEKISNIEEQSRPKRKYSYWTSKMFPKYEELMDYLNLLSLGLLKSMSGHAPFYQLVENYTNINCQRIILHHGSEIAKKTLKPAIEKELEKKCKSTRVVIANSSLKFTI